MPESPHAPKELLIFFGCVAGIYGSFLAWGYYQARLAAPFGRFAFRRA
jgi:hypothetical protein